MRFYLWIADGDAWALYDASPEEPAPYWRALDLLREDRGEVSSEVVVGWDGVVVVRGLPPLARHHLVGCARPTVWKYGNLLGLFLASAQSNHGVLCMIDFANSLDYLLIIDHT